MKVLGVDLGDRRVGFAIGESELRIASPHGMRKVTSPNAIIKAILDEHGAVGAERVVLGLPLNLNGRSGPKAKQARAIAAALEEEGLEVVLWDERLTTAEAERTLRAADLNRKQRRDRIDAVAAQRILSSYLEATFGG